MRSLLKRILHYCSVIFVSPCIFSAYLEKLFFAGSEEIFLFWGHLFAVLPGLPGMFLRRAYYCMTLDQCSHNVYIGFAAIMTHRSVIIKDDVYIGPFSLIGSCQIGPHCFIGSRVSILSGKKQHSRNEQGRWMASEQGHFVRVSIAENVWIGEGAIVMTDVGSGCMIAAGAVVTAPVLPNRLVGGNPARVIRTMEIDGSGERG